MCPQHQRDAIDRPARPRDGKLDVAVVGLGWWGRAIVRALEGSEKMRVVTSVDVDPSAEEFANGQGIGFSTDYAVALSDENVEAVILCTPHSLHGDQIARAARAKMHVFCEKPLALTRREAIDSVDICRANDVVLGVGHEHRFKPPMQELTRMAKDGEFGVIMQSEATWTMDNLVSLKADNWRMSSAEAPCGPLTSLAIHAVDLCVSMHGTPQTVLVSLRKVAAPPLDDSLSILIRFEGNVDALITSLMGPPFSARFALYGDRGWAEVRDKTHPESPEGWILTKTMRGGRMESIESPPTSLVLAGLDAFADAARGRAPYPIPHEEMIATASVVEAIVKSSASGRTEPVESLTYVE